MSQVDGAIVIKAKIDTKDAIAGSKDLLKHTQSLKDAINSFGKDAKESSSAYVDMISNAANILSDLENTFFDIEAEAQRVKESILDSGKVTNSYSELKAELEALTEEMKAFEEAGIQADSLEYQELAENIRKVSEALNFQEGLASLQQLEDEYIELTQYVDLLKQTQLDSIDIHVYEELSEQIKNIVSAISKYYGENEIKKSLDEANESANQLNQRVSEGNAAVGADVKTEVSHFMTAAKEFFTATKEFQNTAKEVNKTVNASIFSYGKSTEQATQAVSQLESEYADLKEKRDALVNEGFTFVSGDKAKKDQKELSVIKEKIMAIEKELKRMEVIKNSAVILNRSFKEWEQMPTLTGKAVEAFTRLKTTAQMTLYGMQHPLQSLNRALAVAADRAMKFAGSLTKAVFSGVVNTIKSIGSSAIRTAANLARMAGSGALSFLRRLAEGAKNAAVQLAKMVSSAVINGLKKLGTFAAKATKAMMGLNKASNGDSLKDGLKMIIRYGFGVRSMFMLVRRLRSAVVEAFENMAKKVPDVNKTISNLVSSLDMLKNSLATAFQPILTAIEPLLTQFMDMLSGALTQVGMFFAALTGQNYVYKATKAQIDYADSLDKTKKKAKEADNQLAGFDHLNILKDTKNDSEDTETPTSNFEKVPVTSKIMDFVKKLKEAFEKGQLYEIGKQFADLVNNFIENTVKWEEIGKRLGKVINGIVDIYNGFMDNVKWEEIGRNIGKSLDALLDTVKWENLGKALSQKINAIFGVLWGLIEDKERWIKAGKALADLAWGYFGNIKWDLIGKTIGTGITNIAAAITEFSTNFPWGEMGKKLDEGFKNFVNSIDIEEVYKAFTTTLQGILDMIIPILTDTESWNKIADDFRTFLTNFFSDDKLWNKASEALRGGLRTAISSLNRIFSDQTLFASIGSRLATFLNDIMGDKELWEGVGTLVNNMMKDILAFGYKFLNEFDAETAAQNIKTAIDQIEWGNIASFTWKLVKDAFGKAGSFVDALFSEQTEGLRGQELNIARNFNAKPIGERMGLKLKEAFSLIPWKDIADTLWKAAKDAFRLAGDFLGALLDVDTKDMDAVERIEAIGEAIGAKLGEFGSILGEKLANVPWPSVFQAAFDIISTTLQGLIGGLLGNENGNGQVLLWIAGGIVALKLGIVPMIAKLIAALASGLMAGGPVLAAGITAAFAAVAVAGVAKLASITAQLVQAQKELNIALGNEMKVGTSNYVYLWKTAGEEAANEFAKTTYGIELTGNDMADNLEQLGRRIAQVQGETFDDVQTIVATAMGTYKTIVSTEGEAAAIAWAENALQIQLTGDTTAENLEQLASTIEQYAGNSKETTTKIVNEACKDVTGDVSKAAKSIDGDVSNMVDNMEKATGDAATAIDKNISSMYEGKAEQIQPDLDAIGQAVDATFGDVVQTTASGMNEESRIITEGVSTISNTVESGVSDQKSTTEKGAPEITGPLREMWAMAKDDITEATNRMSSDVSGSMGSMTADTMAGTTDQREEVYRNWDLIATYIKYSLLDMEYNIQSSMNRIHSIMYDGMNTISNMDWRYVGQNICYGIADGINSCWRWLNDLVWNLANSLFISAKNALGIRSPSKVFRNEVGYMLGAGLAEGIDDSQHTVLGSLTDMANAMVDEMQDTDLTADIDVNENRLLNGLDGALTAFTDNVENSFVRLTQRLQAIADTVTFVTPDIAAGTILPYAVQGDININTSDISTALDKNNEELISVIIQAANNQTSAIVQALMQYSSNNKGTDLTAATNYVIEEINRRTRAMGKSPLLI